MIFSRLLHLTIIILIILIQPRLSCCSLAPGTRIVTETRQCVTLAPKFAVLKDCTSGDPNQLIYREAVNATHIVMYNSKSTKALCYDRVTSRVVALKVKRYCDRPGESISSCVPRRQRYECHMHEVAAQGYVYFNFGNSPQDFIAWKKGGALRKAKDRFCDVKNKVRHNRSKRRSGSARSKELLHNDISASREAESLEHYVSHEKREVNSLVSKEKEYSYERFKSQEQPQLLKRNLRRNFPERRRHSSKRRQNSLERRRNSSERRRNSSERRRHRGGQRSGKCRKWKDKFMRFMYDT